MRDQTDKTAFFLEALPVVSVALNNSGETERAASLIEEAHNYCRELLTMDAANANVWKDELKKISEVRQMLIEAPGSTGTGSRQQR